MLHRKTGQVAPTTCSCMLLTCALLLRAVVGLLSSLQACERSSFMHCEHGLGHILVTAPVQIFAYGMVCALSVSAIWQVRVRLGPRHGAVSIIACSSDDADAPHTR
jgi:hypothetical protein